MSSRPLSPVVKNDDSRLMSFSYPPPGYHKLTRLQSLQIKQELEVDDVPSLVNHRPIKFCGGLKKINDNDINYYNPPVFNLNGVVHQIEQKVDQQNKDVASPSRGKSRPTPWTDELQVKFIDIVDRLGGPRVAKPRHIMKNMEHMGVSYYQITNHLQV
ncbi:hypothetical protein HAX54_003441, partial [Datura stramonium]|nr:hypothetical protein [Datura stramonium]